MFDHGIETKVPVNEMKVVAEKSHGHMKKKKKDEQVTKEMSSKEKMKKGLYNK
jgi:hypothetical protein